MRPKPPGLQPPRFTLVVQKCRRVRYRWRQWAWIPLLAPAVRWVRRAQTTVAAVAVAGPLAVAVWYLPAAIGPTSPEVTPVAAPTQGNGQVTALAQKAASLQSAPASADARQPGPPVAAVAAPAATVEATSAVIATAKSAVAPVTPGLTNLLQSGLAQLPALSLPSLSLPSVVLPGVSVTSVQLSVPTLAQVNLLAQAATVTGLLGSPPHP
jgi:hypothetical protein